MQNAWIEKLQSLYNVTRVPLSLLDGGMETLSRHSQRSHTRR